MNLKQSTAGIRIIAGLSIVLLVVFGFLIFNRSLPETLLEEEIPEEEPHADLFGLDDTYYLVEAGVVGNRQTLSHILAQFGLGAAAIDQIAREMAEVFSPRRIRAGQSYYGYLEPDSMASLRYFVYEISPLEFLRIHFADSLLQIERAEKETTLLSRSTSGIIESSLWNALTRSEASPELAIRMAEILAWEVDFYRIQKGDQFRVVYEERFVGDQSVGIERVDAIHFVHQGREIYGFHFEKDTISGFFNPQGDNLRKVFLKMPLEFGRISSRFSHSRLHPILNTRRPHYGTDYAAPHGTPILSVGDGVVVHARYNSGNGNYVRIRHNSVYETQYLHMSRFAEGIRPGARVRQGQVIGYVGSTGLATGPHVCFRFWKNGQQVDHLREEFPSADALPEEYHEEFFLWRDYMIETLQKIPPPSRLPA